uniref:Alpha-taxilin n=1 Tax=Strigamia maritima TaxID=126957 RepID=T1J644_STRMM
MAEAEIEKQGDGIECIDHLPDASDVIETIDASSCCRNQQEDVIIFNVDFEEMAQAVFGQLDLVDQIIAGDALQEDATRIIAESDEKQEEKRDLPVISTVRNPSVEKVKSGKGKSKTKVDKGTEHILKALNSLHTTEEKLAALCKKYADLMEEHRNVQLSLKQGERRNVQLCKEKEQILTEHSKAVLTRSRLESLCRELQRQNKLVKDESLLRVREEEEKRKESTFNEISTMMQDNNQKNSKLRDENLELAQKLKTLVENYELREQQVENLLKHKDMEVQLADAKLAKANAVMNEEREKSIQEKHKLLVDLTEYQKRCHEMTVKEVQLRTQLNMYSEKYEEFQTTIAKSNDVFSHFKDEMDKMSKKIKKLEKETVTWRSRWEGSNKALLDMATDRQKHDAEMVNAQKKVSQLEKLCRALQLERQSLLAQLKGENAPFNPDDSIDNCVQVPTLSQDGVVNDERLLKNCDKKISENVQTNANNSKVGKGKKKNKVNA